MSSEAAIQALPIVLNGESRTVPAGTTLAGLLQELGIAEDRVAIELNRVIVRRPEWAGAILESGSQIEIVQFVGGG